MYNKVAWWRNGTLNVGLTIKRSWAQLPTSGRYQVVTTKTVV